MGPNLKRVGCSLALACLAALGGCGGSEGPQGPAPPPPADDGGGTQAPDPPADPANPGVAAPRLVVAFMLDPRITDGAYMGDRWVTPETFTLIHDGEVVSVKARAHVDERGSRRDVSASWTSADPGMLTVAPGDAHQVELTVHRAGQTTLTVTEGERTTSLTVAAVQDGGGWRIDISQ